MFIEAGDLSVDLTGFYFAQGTGINDCHLWRENKFAKVVIKTTSPARISGKRRSPEQATARLPHLRPAVAGLLKPNS